MGFELKYYVCPKCNATKLAKNLDTGNFVCDNTEGGCTHFISGKEGHRPEEPQRHAAVSQGNDSALASAIYKFAMTLNKPMNRDAIFTILRHHGYI